MKNRGLGFKLAFYIISTMVIIVGIIIWWNYGASRQILVNNVEENAANLTRATVNKITTTLKSVSKIPENQAQVMENFDISPDQLKRYIRMVVENNPGIFGSCVAFEPYSYYPDSLYFAPYFYKTGDSISYENLGTESYQYFYWDWYQVPAVLQEPVWSEPYFDEGGGNVLMCTYSVPFYRKQNSERVFHGIVTVDISLAWLDSLISSIKIFETGYAFLISSNGTFISHPLDSFEMNQTIFCIAEEYNEPYWRDIGRSMIQGESNFIPFHSVLTGEQGYMYYYPLGIAGWSIAVVFPEDELFADLHRLNTRLFLIGASGIILLLTLIIIISGRITRPLARLARAARNIGGGNFDVAFPETHSNDEIAQLTHSIREMQKELKKYMQNLQDTTAAKERIESELKIARDIQQGIIPKIFPPFPNRDDVDLYAVLQSARQVGGDLYDFFLIDDYKLCFAIGDVSGKGVPASLFMAITRTLLRAKALKDDPVDTIVKNMNAELCKGNENSMFVTFFLGIIDLRTGWMEYCNAGHNYPYILRTTSDIEVIDETHGTPLGIFEDIDYKSGKVRMNKGDNLVLYTDGVTEAANPKDELYGEDRLKLLLINHFNTSPRVITQNLVKDVENFSAGAEQSDDITILILTYYLQKPPEKEQLQLKNSVEEIAGLNVFIDGITEKWSLPAKVNTNLKLVLEEVVSNIIFYAFDDKKEHIISLWFEKDNEKIMIKVADEGKAFDPLKVPPPGDLDTPAEERHIGGLGIHFVKTFMDDLYYSRKGNKNILTMIKKLR